MKVKYNNQETFHYIDDYIFVNADRVRLIGEGALDNTSGFDVYTDEETQIYLNSEYVVIYEKGDGFVEYTKDQTIYFDYYVANEDNYITGVQVFKSNKLPTDVKGVFFKSGQGKEYAEPTSDILFMDEDGVYNYKIVNDKIVAITDEEKNNIKAQYEQNIVKAKISNFNAICSSFIVQGIDYNNKHYSYELTDQNNLKNAIELAKTTKMEVPYHADKESYSLYNLNDITSIYILNQMNLIHHTVYFNQLKLYMSSLQSIEEINAIQYGQPLDENYLVVYNQMIEQAKNALATFLNIDVVTLEGILNSSITVSQLL